MDLRAAALASQPCLMGLGAIRRIGPNIGGGVVGVDEIAQEPPLMARRVGDTKGPDETKAPVDP